ncbi:CDP-glycerol glycerophosphotransferase family protein [Exiguobacterium sp. SL14]|nr:CDP-glycerol glycerophosphotransferase family protein [Exiguobacterium sp. SL14]MCY1689909.1 CDP-glycerol glycerophosphotransferase family protein [Exiguobacterium sp. SL14]
MRTLKKIKNVFLFFLSSSKRRGLSYLFYLFPIERNKIVITNYYGKGYGDNAKYILQELIKMDKKVDVVWLVNDLNYSDSMPPYIRLVKYGSIKSLYELSTSKIWIDNSRKSLYSLKKKKQIYIQTWHGSISLKKIEKDAQNKLNYFYVRNAKIDSKMADYFISNGKFSTEMYRNSFWFKGEILEYGTPRCDVLINPPLKNKKVKDNFKISYEKKIILYAPTFRKVSNSEVYRIDFKKLNASLKERFGGEWVILIRMHPNETNLISLASNDEYEIYDASLYDDMYELLSETDVLITDYSSSMFEFSYTNKPVFLFARDIEDYKKDRDFYFDIYSLPYKISKNNKELGENIKEFRYEEYQKKLKMFKDKLSILEDGNSSKKVAELIYKIIN